MPRPLGDLILLAIAFAAGALVATALGADNTGIALGIGQLTFAAALVYLLLAR
jgi:uncharacterized membrane protein